jgi:hypothetical protein
MPAFRETRRVAFTIAAITVAGFALTLYIFYPGIMTFDARYVYRDIAKGFYGDWQSPVMTFVWSLIDPIAPGTASILLLMVTLYWLAFGLLALAVARRAAWLALLVPLLAFTPPAFVFVGIIWRDVLFAVSWLLAAALVFALSNRDWKSRVPGQILALALLVFGFLIRPNALAAAPVLAAYILWPMRFSFKRAAVLYIPVALGLFGLMHVVYYDWLGAARQHALHSVLVFDLGGISHFAKDNSFPGTWTPDQSRLITETCYNPVAWDVYWTRQPCSFVMARLESEKIFGTTELTDAWKSAIAHHPLAYLRHRVVFIWTLLTEPNVSMWTMDLDDTSKIAFADNPRLMALKALHDFLQPTPLFWIGSWLLLAVIVCLAAWRRRDTASGAFALGVCGSAVIYLMTFSAIGVATDFRYALWTVLAALVGLVAVVLPVPPATATDRP